MAKGEYVIAEQLKHWLELRGKTRQQLSRFFNGIGSHRIQRWLDGGLVREDTIVRMAQFFHTTESKFMGRNLNHEDKTPCGKKRLLEILNEEGGDYLGEDGPLVRLNTREWKLELDDMFANLRSAKKNEDERG